jgi:PIN domain nuclease of toxin-antitoxin system
LPAGVLARVSAKLVTPGSALTEMPVSGAVVSAMAAIPRADVPDMPDRIIAGTAVHLGLPLISRDGKIRASSVATIW